MTRVTRPLLLDSDADNRALAGRQFAIQQLTYWTTVGSIALAEIQHPSLQPGRFAEWIGITTVLWLVRVLLFLVVYYKTPAQLTKSVLLRLLPLGIVLIAGGSWIWTVSVYSSNELTVRELFMCIGFLNTTIAMTSMWTVTPLAVIVYNVGLWGAYSYHLHANGLAGIPELLALNLTVFVILWLFVTTAIVRLRTQMTKARELEGMARQLSASNAHLDALQRQAKTRLENRSRFFAETTHDFKQRLHGAKLMILSAKALVADDRAARHVHRLAEEMDQLEQYMMGILSSARSEALGRAPPDVATVPLQAVFQQLDLQYEELAAQTRKILRFRNTPFRVWSDRAMLERVLGNLVSNALKFTRSSVLVAARRRGAALVIEVWDQGPGIAADAHHRIFEAYQQESGAEDLQSGGVGLGLAVVKRLTHMLGYTVSLHSRLGAGSVFRITIPEHLVIAE